MRSQVARGPRVRRVVITRSGKGNAELADELKARGYVPIPVDTIEFLPPEDWSSVDEALGRLHDFDWLLFTSATGAEFFARRMGELSMATTWPARPAVAAVGERTSAALRRDGVKVDFVPSAYLTSALADELPTTRGRDVLMLRADIGNPEVVSRLERRGFRVTDLAVYRTGQVADGRAVASAVGGAEAIVFASPSAVEGFVKSFPPSQGTSKLLALCIGPVTAEAARRNGFKSVVTSETHTMQALLELLVQVTEGGA